MAHDGLIAALDIGTTKVCCFVAEADQAGQVRVLGIGHHASSGIKGGMIVEMEAAERSIRAAVHAAEQMAGTTVREVVANITGGSPSSHIIASEAPVEGAAIGERDIRRVTEGARLTQQPADRHAIHAIPVGFVVDGSNGIRDPRGLHGRKLAVKMHVITAGTSAMQNIQTCVARCHLDVTDFVASPYAAGLGSLVEDELDLGVTVIDMGGGTTSIAVFFDGALVYTDGVPVGGGHVTNDIARGLSTPLSAAERLKTLHGSCLPSPSDERDLITAPQVGEDDDGSGNQFPKSYLVSIIAPRVEETLELVRGRLEASGYDKVAGRRVVLTGGASQLPGMREVTGLILNKQVRMGRPIRLSGLAEATGGPAFATCAGLLSFAVDDRGEARPALARSAEASNGLFGRLGEWFRENF